MKKASLSLLMFSLFMSPTMAQDFAPVGAKWYFNHSTVNPNFISYDVIEVVENAIVNGQDCVELERSFYNADNNLELSDTYYMYEDANKVYYYEEDLSQFCLLYDFNLDVGETYTLDCWISASTGEPMIVTIDSAYWEDVNGVSLKVQHISSDDGLVSDFYGKTQQRLGNVLFLFPLLENYEVSSLRCYEDDVIGNVVLNEIYDCDYSGNPNSVVELENPQYLYPNPVSDYLTVDLDKEKIIFNVMGERILKTKEKYIDVSIFSSGIYFVKVGSQVLRFVKE
mgnify:FL=1